MLRDENDLSSTVMLPPDERLFQEIIFMPGGANVWSYFWTKGILYTMSGKHGSAVANLYRTIRQDGEHYMVIYFASHDGVDNSKALPVLYRQVDTIAYSEDQMRPKIDKVDYPFVEDPEVSGAWSVVDFVRHAEDFYPAHQYSPKKRLSIVEMQFLPRGICLKFTRSEANGKK